MIIQPEEGQREREREKKILLHPVEKTFLDTNERNEVAIVANSFLFHA